MDDENDFSLNDEIKINSNGVYFPNIIFRTWWKWTLIHKTVDIPEQTFIIKNEDNGAYYMAGKVLIGYDVSQDATKLQVEGIYMHLLML